MSICASCRRGFSILRRCFSSRSVSGLLGPGAEGCDLLADRGLGGPAGVDLRKLSARPRSAARAALCCRCCGSSWLCDRRERKAKTMPPCGTLRLVCPAGVDLRKLSARLFDPAAVLL